MLVTLLGIMKSVTSVPFICIFLWESTYASRSTSFPCPLQNSSSEEAVSITEVKEEQSEKAQVPMLVTLLGMVTEVKEVQ